ncbi:hypothetical protein JTB14_022701 [Gonioctena quinquepunctata]|nr:hypothetical protein JTB14_022701 [Gonioctena quinquepunctata]
MNLKEVKKLPNELSNLVENKPDEVDNVEFHNLLKGDLNVITSENNQIKPGGESTNLIESVNEDGTLTEVQIVGKNKVGINRFNKTKTKLKQHKLSTSEKIPDEETKNRRRKKKRYLKEKSPNPTGKTYSTDFSINIIVPDSIHPSTADIVTSDQRKTSTDPVTSQDEDDDKLQDSLPKGSPTVMSRILILGDEYAEGFIKVITPSIETENYDNADWLIRVRGTWVL